MTLLFDIALFIGVVALAIGLELGLARLRAGGRARSHAAEAAPAQESRTMAAPAAASLSGATTD